MGGVRQSEELQQMVVDSDRPLAFSAEAAGGASRASHAFGED